MAPHRDVSPAQYIPLRSRTTSLSASTQKHEREEAAAAHQVQSALTPTYLDRRRQTWPLLIPQTLRWLATVAISALLLAVLRIYSHKGNFTGADKNAFNVIITGLSVGLGINIFAQLLNAILGSLQRIRKRSALEDIGRRKAQRPRGRLGPVHRELMEDFCAGHRVHSFKAMDNPPSSLATKLHLLNLAHQMAQISVALVTVTFDMVDGKSFTDTYTKMGTVNAPFLGCYRSEDASGCPDNTTAHLRAHLYGERIIGASEGLYSTIDQVVDSEHDFKYFYSPGHFYSSSGGGSRPEYAYRFKEYNPTDREGTYPRFTNRTISAYAGECLVFQTMNETLVNNVDGQGPGTSFTYQDGNSTQQIEIPASSLGASSTTYMYKGFQAPQSTDYRCGPRCMWLWAYKNPALTDEANDADPPRLYKCPVTVSEVSNTWNESHIIPDDVARIAAVSIALQGRWSGSNENPNFNQVQFYSIG
ncbi:MAG: hypothetical protein Q9169_007193 [Polycauliona sp. 2 TL-2023]